MPPPRLVPYGDRAWLVEYEPSAAARPETALGLAAAIRRELNDEAVDVVSTPASVCVHVATPAALEQVGGRLRSLLDAAPTRAVADGTLVEIPVVYGGDVGPDLETVAARAGLSPSEVVRRHTSPVYRVRFLGFLPGFPYLGTVDPAIQAVRHSTPRPRVAAGAVGIAGDQTGIYPRESPGGWQIIGRTAEWLFDPRRTPPARLAPGDRVRFVDVTATEGS